MSGSAPKSGPGTRASPAPPAPRTTLDLFAPREKAPLAPSVEIPRQEPRTTSAEPDVLPVPLKPVPPVPTSAEPVAARTINVTAEPLSVSQLNDLIRGRLRREFSNLTVTGEVVEAKSYPSGVYFSIKDAGASIGCFFAGSGFRTRFKFDLVPGLQVVIRGSIDFWSKRGETKLTVASIEPVGEGALELAFRQMKDRLEREGLFDPAHKKPLPRFPRGVGVVTSAQGAAVRDFLRALRKRWPGQRVVIAPALVQGHGAASDIARAIGRLDRLADIDVIVVTRGGGSKEDLWCFNEEPVARAIFAAKKPVVSGVGHEVDVTIADFVADVRAQTPTEAARLVVPDRAEILGQIESAADRAAGVVHMRLSRAKNRLLSAQGRLGDPRVVLARFLRRLAVAETRLTDVERARLQTTLGRIRTLDERLRREDPKLKLSRAQAKLDGLEKAIDRAWHTNLTRRHTRVALAVDKLSALSPLNTVARGYALAFRHTEGATLSLDAPLVQSSTELKPGDGLALVLADRTTVTATVTHSPGPALDTSSDEGDTQP